VRQDMSLSCPAAFRHSQFWAMCWETLVRFQSRCASISSRMDYRSLASNLRPWTYNGSISGSHYTNRISEKF